MLIFFKICNLNLQIWNIFLNSLAHLYQNRGNFVKFELIEDGKNYSQKEAIGASPPNKKTNRARRRGL